MVVIDIVASPFVSVTAKFTGRLVGQPGSGADAIGKGTLNDAYSMIWSGAGASIVTGSPQRL